MKSQKLFSGSIFISLFACLLGIYGCSANIEKQASDFVNPFIGTGGHGHTYPGAVVPKGMVQLSPDTRLAGWDACGGYYYDDASLLGFSHTHLSGTGIGDYGDFLFLPYTNELVYMKPNGEDKEERYGSRFSHEQESASPGYYNVFLKDYDIWVELTATERTGVHQYTFPKAEKSGLLIDLTTSIQQRQVVQAELNVISDTEISGMRRVAGWAPDRYVYFYALFSKPFTCDIEADKVLQKNAKKALSPSLRAFLDFNGTHKDEKIMVKVGISFVDYEGAKNNLLSELNDKPFDEIKTKAQAKWEKELSKILVETKDKTSKEIFYTALYHASLEPTIASDVDGRFRTMENKIEQDTAYMNYTVFSLWDTFRALHPLNTIISPEENQAMIRSLIKKYEEGGILPMWELSSNYTGTMLGYHAVSVIVDAYMKGDRDFNIEKAYEASIQSSSYDTLNVSPTIDRHILKNNLMPIGKYYKNTVGYIPSDKDNESVAKGLEYAYNDWLIAQFAKDLGKDADYVEYSQKAEYYKAYFDKSINFMRGKMSDGSWKTPFDPKASNHRADDYCEGNAWQWTWFVPHDIDGLARLMGGRDAFIAKLDSLFSVSSEIPGKERSADITGMIGQYAHGNEPSHQTVHIYNLIGQPWKTQKLVDDILYTLYFNNPNGLSGNEDCGQMSAWYILNSMGFYSYCPGVPYYSIGRPIFDKVTIPFENDKKFVIQTVNNSKENKYVKEIRLNGKELTRPFFSHKELMSGGLLEIVMSDKPKMN